MGKTNKTGRSKSEPKHVRLYEHMERTPAWRDLSGVAAKAWLTIGLMHNGSNNGAIGVSARELGKRIGVHYVSAARAIRELENAGFISCVKDSSFSQTRRAAEYRLTHLADAITGNAATRDYTRRNHKESLD